ncbi:MAG: hypothetical protein HYY01_09460 [Chloroflexi bacterium]|nr:hypothetical protein [Chloroflexota bacterium]
MASDLVEIELSGGQKVYAQADREMRLRPEQVAAQPGFAAAGLPTGQQVVERFRALSEFISERTQQVIERYQALGSAIRPSKVVLEFAIGVEGSAGIPFLADGKGTANMTITVEWSPSSRT